MDINWQSIRTIKGSQREGFEELVVQLARAESPASSEFERVGAQDAGVECYCVLDDGGEWGWQAKYFTSALDPGKWGQIDGSVKTALDKHPALVRYFVCVPWDRPDARNPSQKSAMQQWYERVSKWKGWAQERNMNVEFVWWGSSELIERLSRPEHIGRLFFWFQEQYFSEAWYRDHLREALESAGPRYTPELHIDLTIAQDLEAFGRTDAAFSQIKAIAREVRSEFNSARPTSADDERVRQNVDVSRLTQAGEMILSAFSDLQPTPADKFPIADIVKQIEAAEIPVSEVLETLRTLSRKYDSSRDKPDDLRTRQNPFQDMYYHVSGLRSGLADWRKQVGHAENLANSRVMILKGEAGTGKTHLLCDVARTRIEYGAPTVLLMGQRFTDSSDPWIQALQQLDMPGAKSEQFIGALESSAQVANRRALLIIDALNEGRGREIWPPNLSAFLSQVEKSSWVDVILSIRSYYEREVIPSEIQERAVNITHNGFEGHEYDAARIFFEHYGIEFPSTPILQPEFRNPLLLKIICEGLKDRGERRMPRGLNGITKVFSLYLESVNHRLAKSLDYNPNDNLVLRALEKIAEQIIDAKASIRWLSRQQVESTVNELLPGRTYSASLYCGLITEDVLTEEMYRYEEEPEEVIRFTYERFSDHIIAKFLLQQHLDVNNPKAAFVQDGSLTYLWDRPSLASQGILEAMCIQVPERTGQELFALASTLLDGSWYIQSAGDAFLQSIIWRAPETFSDNTLDTLNELSHKGAFGSGEVVEAMLTVTTVPENPFNAKYLDSRLRQESMPDRDAWWSTYLHRAWENDSGPIHRLLDWASAISGKEELEDEVTDLAVISLAWMLSTSNRFVRDKATKGLVSLLTNRLDATLRMVNRFDDVDDPYVRERIYAVAYGVAMRSYDADKVEKLGLSVYENIFASGNPPAHILLRDYARGIVERALYLNPALSINPKLIRPPYSSNWPMIPSEHDIDRLTPHWKGTEGRWGTLEWARNRIRWSVMDDDFAFYVIGTNSSSRSTRWLERRLDEERWQSPNRRLEILVENMTDSERSAWYEFKARESIIGQKLMVNIRFMASKPSDDDGDPIKLIEDERGKQISLARSKVLSAMTASTRSELKAIWESQSKSPPGFDLSVIQRYIVGRVFELGWTVERFGYFDSISIGDSGRDAHKAERIGKKYQWIAYHEILAYLAENYQYGSWYGREGQEYQGAWQDIYRDIDPSCTLSVKRGDSEWSGHNQSWWARTSYEVVNDTTSHSTWLGTENDIPAIADLLQVTRPDDKTNWLVAESFFSWQQTPPPDVEPYDIQRRELWIMCHGYFIHDKEADKFIRWAKGVDFWGRWMPEPPDIGKTSLYQGEYIWSPAFKHLNSSYENSEEEPSWNSSRPKCPVSLKTAAFRYYAEEGGFDCSIDEGYSLYLPNADFVVKHGLRRSSNGADFINSHGEVVAFDPTVYEDGPNALLLRKNELMEQLKNDGITLCWAVLGEKWLIGGIDRDRPNKHMPRRFSGAYVLTENGLNGFAEWKDTA